MTTLAGVLTTVMRLWPVAAFVLGYLLIESELTRNDTTQTELQQLKILIEAISSENRNSVRRDIATAILMQIEANDQPSARGIRTLAESMIEAARVAEKETPSSEPPRVLSLSRAFQNTPALADESIAQIAVDLRVALIVSHSQRMPGVISSDGTSEFVFSGSLAQCMANVADAAGITARVFARDEDEDRNEIYDRVKRWGYDFAIEIHGNAANGKARGSEAYIFVDEEKVKAMATTLIDWHPKPRGLRLVSDTGGARVRNRGLNNFILWEVAFIDNPTEVALIVEKQTEICSLLATHTAEANY